MITGSGNSRHASETRDHDGDYFILSPLDAHLLLQHTFLFYNPFYYFLFSSLLFAYDCLIVLRKDNIKNVGCIIMIFNGSGI